MTGGPADNDNTGLVLSKKEVTVIYKAFAFIEIGIKISQYQEYLGAGEEFVDKLTRKFSDIIKGPKISTGGHESHIVINKITGDELSFHAGEEEIRAIYGALANISIWVSEEDISSVMGISSKKFNDVKKGFVIFMRAINRKGGRARMMPE